MPSHGSSIGSSVKVPLALTRTALQPPNHPSNAFCQAFMWRQSLPMGSKGAPYSPCRHVLGGSGKGWALGQMIDDECCMPKLCPGSCTSTTQSTEALYQVSRAG